jgi:hypothetical protein
MHKINDTVLLKQKKRPVLDITGFFFRMSTQVNAEVRHLSTHAEKETSFHLKDLEISKYK